MNELLYQIKYSLGAKVGLNGSNEKGKIEIYYHSTVELVKLVNTLGSIDSH